MKLSDKTVSLLKSFSQIYPQIMIRPGSVLRIASPTCEIVARANVEELLTQEAGIADLPKFLSILSLFSDPDVEFTNTHVAVSSGRQTIRYTVSDEKVIKAPPDRDINPTRLVTFKLPKVEVERALKATTVLGHTEIAITGKDGALFIEGLTLKNPTSNTYRLDVGETDKTFRQIINKDILKIVSRDYEVSLTTGPVVEFAAEDITYWVALNMKSDQGNLR